MYTTEYSKKTVLPPMALLKNLRQKTTYRPAGFTAGKKESQADSQAVYQAVIFLCELDPSSFKDW